MRMVALHHAFDQLNWPNDKRVDKSRKCTVLNSVQHAQRLFLHYLFVRLIATVNYGVDNRHRDYRVVYTIEQTHETLVSDYLSELIHH